MKKMPLLIMCLLVGFLVGAVQANPIELSFDTLFPETISKQLHDTVLQLWSDVVLLHDADIDDTHRKELADLIVGQLIRIEYMLEYIRSKGDMRIEDITYVQEVLQALVQEYKRFFDQPHVVKIWQLIDKRFDAFGLDQSSE